MNKFIIITDKQIVNLTTNRLLNIFRINRTFLFKILNKYGFDTSNNGNNINWFVVNDDLYHNKEYNQIDWLNIKIKQELDNRNNENRNSKQ
ncbi:MAG: hypothetical protein PF569_02525 [Candidatus Woesearchaeota archaeon]|jgi:hypothetical protein|nr:hypothetical protein [Candidatus Woesearchaeota archaeon]